MGLVKRVAVVFVRPIYQAFFERPVWWFLSRVKTYFFAETMARLASLEVKIDAIEKAESYDGRFNHLDAHNAQQWDSIEQLVLAILNQPRPALAGEFDRSGEDSRAETETINVSHNLH
jgi:hypothetical protein